jgi:hypothetical protein
MTLSFIINIIVKRRSSARIDYIERINISNVSPISNVPATTIVHREFKASWFIQDIVIHPRHRCSTATSLFNRDIVVHRRNRRSSATSSFIPAVIVHPRHRCSSMTSSFIRDIVVHPRHRRSFWTMK